MVAGLTISQVSRRTGMSVDALRYYEREGLIPQAIARDSAGRRRYAEADVEWFTVTRNLRASGMSVTTLRRYVGLVRAGEGNEQIRLALLRDHEAAVTTTIAELTDAQALIRAKIQWYADALTAGTAGTLWAGDREHRCG